jgi:hypothetical protein
MGSRTHYACCGKEMLGWIHEKMATQESAQEVASSLPSIQLLLETTLKLAVTHAL